VLDRQSHKFPGAPLQLRRGGDRFDSIRKLQHDSQHVGVIESAGLRQRLLYLSPSLIKVTEVCRDPYSHDIRPIATAHEGRLVPVEDDRAREWKEIA
jgi:hypothetical protein